MTTIAYDGKVLVGDRRSHVNLTTLPPLRKVHRLRAPNGRIALFGFSGNTAYMAKYLHWLRGGDAPQHQDGDSMKWGILAIDDAGVVWSRCETTNCWDCLGRTKWAMGSGADYALGAMRAGKSAAAAVRIAATLDLQTGDGVDVVRF